MRSGYVILAAAFAAVFQAASVEAGPITYTYTGEVTSVSAGLAGQFSVGQILSGSFTYDDSGPDVLAAVNQYGITATAGSAQIGGYVLSVGASTVSFNEFFLNETIGYQSQVTGAQVGLFFPNALSLILEGGGPGLYDAFGAGVLPLLIPGIGNFASSTFTLSFPAPIGITNVVGTLTSIAVAQPPSTVPEPATLFLLGGGLAALAARRKKRH